MLFYTLPPRNTETGSVDAYRCGLAYKKLWFCTEYLIRLLTTVYLSITK